MTKVINPYLTPNSPPTRKVEFHSSKEDIHELKSRLSRHGVLDAVLGALFFKFMESLKETIPVALSVEQAELNEQRVHNFIHTLKFNA